MPERCAKQVVGLEIIYMNDKDSIVLNAVFHSARTTQDGGWRVSFDLDESSESLVNKISKLKNKSFFLVITEKQKETLDINANDFFNLNEDFLSVGKDILD